MSSVSTKVKGIMIRQYPSEDDDSHQVADGADLVYPALENNAFFIITNQIKTFGQKAMTCPGVEGVDSACNTDNDCVPLKASPSEVGVHTGNCLKQPSGSGVCELYAWCPLENDTHVLKDGQRTLEFIRNYTVYIKNDIEFPKFKVRRNNREAWISNATFGSCRYDPDHPANKYCPIFKLSTIFDKTGVDINTIYKGGVLGIVIRWDCDLDYGVEYCKPQYSFTSLEDSDYKFSGFNFR
ncbi:unnamed protein product [Dibothriocephalus latus]|uniref:Uncharacterized protein n=1 Tax=Dibothriocephalus latus TaxID=60516 RepID=A0A3P7MJ48_DIBLA|nr:unnamed protein product [Dibothriocephalus latus]